MKRCPECRRDYHDDSLLYCLDDGSALLDGPATGDHDEPMTAKMVIPARPSLGGSESPTGAIAAEHISRELKGHKFRSGAIILIVLVVLTGFAYGLYKFFDRPSGAPQRTSASINVQKLTGDGRTRMPVISPDGKFLVYAKLEGGQESLWIKQIQTGSSVNVVKPGESDEFWAITFSPDGNFVYYNAGGRRSSKEPPTVFRVPTLGGTPTKFLSNAYFVQFSTDGKQISFRRPDLPQGEKIFIANADGSQEREIYSVGGMQYFSTAPAWSPDGKYLSIAVGDDALVPNPSVQARLISVADGSAKALGERKVEVLDDMVWHPSGDSLIAVAQMDASSATTQLWEVSYPLGEYRKLSNDVNGYTGVSITGDGSSIVTGELYARSSIWVSPDLKPENAKQIMPAASDTWGIAWTPDGQIVYSSDQTGEPQIWIVNADGTNAKPLTGDKTRKFLPTVSKDGRNIVYTSNTDQLILMDINGGNSRVLVRQSYADNAHISPDGKWVIYSAYIDGNPRVARVSIDGGRSQVLTPDVFATEPRYSTDGTRFACFVMDQKAAVWSRLAIYPADGGEAIKMLDVPGETSWSRGPVWTPDDKNIVVVYAPGEKQNLWQVPVDGSPGKQMTDFDVPGISRREYSLDGKRIAIVRAEGFGNAIMITGYR